MDGSTHLRQNESTVPDRKHMDRDNGHSCRLSVRCGFDQSSEALIPNTAYRSSMSQIVSRGVV
jgi:hypothetical protein